MIERYTVENTRLEPMPGAGLSDEEKIEFDHVIQQMLRRLIESDPRHRMRHFALMVLTLEKVQEDGSHIVTSDTVTSMTHDHMHEVFRDWVRKETQ